MRKHMSSKHFTEFAEFVDDHDVRWEVQLLENESLDIEEGRRGRGGRNDEVSQAGKLWSRKDLAHVLIQYSVPPGNSKEFIDAWTDLAERTIEEKGNRMYSLRRVATDNTHFYAYGTWTSMGDYMDHFESKHLGKFLDDVEDKNIIYFLDPLEEICEE
jgi:quinol monooxygenase YgiN